MPKNAPSDYHVSYPQVRRIINILARHIEKQAGLEPNDIFYNSDSDNSNTAVFPPHKIEIGVQSLLSTRRNDYVKDKFFVFTILNLFHEEQHLHRLQQFQNTNASDNVKIFARNMVIRNAIPEYYQAGYFRNPNEIDAELAGIKNTRDFFKANYPEIDVDTELVNIIRKSKEWYADKHIATIEQGIQNLQTELNNPHPAFVKLPAILPYKTYSQGLQDLYNHPKYNQAYKACKKSNDGIQGANTLLQFIEETQPWWFLNYKCLQDEWTNRIKNSTPPIDIQQHQSKRGAEAEAQFGHMLEKSTKQITMEHENI